MADLSFLLFEHQPRCKSNCNEETVGRHRRRNIFRRNLDGWGNLSKSL